MNPEDLDILLKVYKERPEKKVLNNKSKKNVHLVPAVVVKFTSYYKDEPIKNCNYTISNIISKLKDKYEVNVKILIYMKCWKRKNVILKNYSKSRREDMKYSK
jgi:hypothetical protein